MEYFLDNDTQDKFLTRRQVNLIGGASGSGKTRMIFQMYKASQDGQKFLGMTPKPGMKWAYISGDRAAESVEETMAHIGVVGLPVFSLVDKVLIGEDLIKKILPKLPDFCGYKPEFIYIDAFTAMVPGGDQNNYDTVGKWLAALQRYCGRQDITILGAAHATKVRENDRIVEARQRILGSSAWGGFSQDVFIVDRFYGKNAKTEEDDNPKRILHILPRNGRERQLKALMIDGVMTLDTSEAEKVSNADFVLEGFMTPGAKFMSADFEHIARKKGVSRATYYRWIHEQVENGRLEKRGRGEYQVRSGVVVSIMEKFNETPKSAEETEAVNTWTSGLGVLDTNEDQGEGESGGVRREVSEVMADLERGADDASPEEVRGAEDAGEVRSVDGREEVCAIEGNGSEVLEDPIGGDAPSDSKANEGAGD